MATPNRNPSVGNRTIVLRGTYNIFEDVCGATAIKPGYLIQRRTVSGIPVVQPHSRQGGRDTVRVATEQPLNGGSTVDTAYAAGDIVREHIARSGDIVLMVLKAGNSVVAGTVLVSNGDGRLIPSTALSSMVSTEHAIGEAYEALNLTASGAVDTLVPVVVW